MITDETIEAGADTGEDGGEGKETGSENITLSKADYDKLNQTLGSLKRELKDFKKPKEEPKETPQTKPDLGLLQKSYLRAAGISDSEEVELALSTAKKWGVEVDALVDDEDFKAKLDKLRTNKANLAATSNIKGGKGTQESKNTPEFYIARGTPPSATEVPDRKTRAKIARAMIENTKSGKKFYND